MEKKWIIRILLLIAYCVPYAFLSINGDANYGTMMFYGVMVVAFFLLCLVSIKTNNIANIFIGNILSFVSSSISLMFGDLEAMSWYFKPFTVQSLLMVISIVVMIIQVSALVVYKIRSRNGNNR